ncbi:transcription factor RelB isoform X1 [Pleurodeles waltl]|uniref:transcription factor RelB isoform X1 n=1 Tax=Pleurodeles waltl TaxID=8319 RepID=UPI0037098BB1
MLLCAEIIAEFIEEDTRPTQNLSIKGCTPEMKSCIKQEAREAHQLPKSHRVLESVSAERTTLLVARGSNPELSVQQKELTVSSNVHNIPDMCNYTAQYPGTNITKMFNSVTFMNPDSNSVSPTLIPRSTAPLSHGQWATHKEPSASKVHHAESTSNVLEEFLQKKTPKLHIKEQPKQRGMRFRYVCEGRFAGSILGASSTDENKTLPTIELSDCDGIPEVKVITCLVWKDWPFRIHPHGLVGKDCHDGICEITIKPKTNKKHSYSNLGIQCVKKKEIEAAVEKKINMGFDPYKAGHWKNQEEVDMNVVRLCFQASYQDHKGQTHQLEPVLSDPIYDKKSTNTSELKIYRLNKNMGQCSGGDEVYLLCDKVQKEDIAVVFHKESWEAKADFSQADVHRQIAIVFKTPSYQDLDITEPVCVEVCLERVTDKVRSEDFYFTYLPKDHDAYGVNLKRKRGFPDVIGELSSCDPHGIEAKRRKTKPHFKDHCSLGSEEVCLPSFGLPVESGEYEDAFSYVENNLNQGPVESTVEDFFNFPELDPMNLYHSEYNGLSSDFDLSMRNLPGPFQNFIQDCDPSPFLLSAVEPSSENTALNSDADHPNTASLIANSMFPSQYKMEGFEFQACLDHQERKELT